ncbi:MAG: CinA family nicotinamide mononucleotide deamidase-related protein [Verrucomicrobia bacterium]|nr:CinA family nicotinamide mononucleotide deamidase-related protein [Verrucomicrobiota bacterium]
MNIELINTGSELLLGRTLNTHAQWLGRQLAEHGFVITRQVTVADTSAEIDDATRESIAKLLGKTMRPDATVLAQIEKYFTSRKRVMLESMKVQALVPEGALVLPNLHGTAPGLAMEVGDKWLIMLPGPPRELKPMFAESVVPLLVRIFPDREEFASRTLRTVGLGESRVEEQIAPSLQPLVARGLTLGYCAHMGQVDVRLEARGAGREELIREAVGIVRSELRENIFGEGDEELEAVVLRLLAERQQTLALAESCTGGLIAHRLTNISGASAVLIAGLVTYANEAKQKFLGVDLETLAARGAVSEAVAREMAEGARHEAGADYALAVTGVAGPAGGTAAKPVGTVFLALAGAGGTVVEKKFNAFDRETFKELTARQALDLLRREILAAKNPQA